MKLSPKLKQTISIVLAGAACAALSGLGHSLVPLLPSWAQALTLAALGSLAHALDPWGSKATAATAADAPE